jgi:CAAX prenyl protease-like protein
MRWNFSYVAAGLGAVVFFLWVALVKSDAGTTAATGIALGRLSFFEAAGWLFFRIVGSVIVAPLSEELAFRGYLIRKLVADDFQSVSPGKFTWISFLGSSILFGALHGEWLAGTVAGMIFALALYRRGSLGDAVVAHGTANGLLSAYVLVTHNWSLWA